MPKTNLRPAGRSTLLRERKRTYFFMVLPGCALYIMFFILPICSGAGYSLTDWNGISKKVNFVGLQNYVSALSSRSFQSALWFTVKYTLLLVTLTILLSVILALLLNSKLKAISFFRTVYFLPAILSMITIGLIFKQIFYRVIPLVGQAAGIEVLSSNILANPKLVTGGILFVNLWQGVALPTLLFLAALQTVPADLYEAASLDGASVWRQFWSITLHYLLPTVSVVLVLTLKGGLTVFDYIKSMTDGGPAGITKSLTFIIYEHAFTQNKYGYSLAEAIIIGLIVGLVSLIQIKSLTGEDKAA